MIVADQDRHFPSPSSSPSPSPSPDSKPHQPTMSSSSTTSPHLTSLASSPSWRCICASLARRRLVRSSRIDLRFTRRLVRCGARICLNGDSGGCRCRWRVAGDRGWRVIEGDFFWKESKRGDEWGISLPRIRSRVNRIEFERDPHPDRGAAGYCWRTRGPN